MGSTYSLSAVRVVRDRVQPLPDLPRLVCASSEILEFVDVVERARGEETQEFAWVRDTAEDVEDDELVDYCVRPQTIAAALARFEREYAKAAEQYPSYYRADATDIATGKPYSPEVRPVINGQVYRLTIPVGQCTLVLLTNQRDKRKSHAIEAGEYEWESVTTGPTLVRVRVTRCSIVERFASLLRDLRACTSQAAKARARLLPKTSL